MNYNIKRNESNDEIGITDRMSQFYLSPILDPKR